MNRRKRFLWIVAVLCLGAVGAGCGTTGSSPTLYQEVQFQVLPSGQSTFTVNELDVGGVRHTFPAGTSFTASSTFYFYFENAPPPYSGTFTLESGGDVTVKLFITPTNSAKASDTTSGPGSTVTVSTGASPSSMPATPIPPTEEVRFDVCVPSLTPGTCFTQGDSGIFGLPFTGTVGDAFQTHLLSGFTPSIYFLEGAQENANGVFRLTPVTGDTLVVQLFINGSLRQTQANTKDVVVKQNL
ncbi:MAG: hypothetical protein ABSA52_07605 [Candidatus Binatia bacterium]|jgi:hypothetical protein